MAWWRPRRVQNPRSPLGRMRTRVPLSSYRRKARDAIKSSNAFTPNQKNQLISKVLNTWWFDKRNFERVKGDVKSAELNQTKMAHYAAWSRKGLLTANQRKNLLKNLKNPQSVILKIHALKLINNHKKRSTQWVPNVKNLELQVLNSSNFKNNSVKNIELKLQALNTINKHKTLSNNHRRDLESIVVNAPKFDEYDYNRRETALNAIYALQRQNNHRSSNQGAHLRKLVSYVKDPRFNMNKWNSVHLRLIALGAINLKRHHDNITNYNSKELESIVVHAPKFDKRSLNDLQSNLEVLSRSKLQKNALAWIRNSSINNQRDREKVREMVDGLPTRVTENNKQKIKAMISNIERMQPERNRTPGIQYVNMSRSR